MSEVEMVKMAVNQDVCIGAGQCEMLAEDTFLVDDASDATNWDFGLIPAGVFAVGDRVWWDENHNGIQDPVEPGIADVTVQLWRGSGQVFGETTTASSGAYRFGSVPEGLYFIRLILPFGLSLTAADQGDYDGLDSDANPATGTTPAFKNPT